MITFMLIAFSLFGMFIIYLIVRYFDSLNPNKSQSKQLEIPESTIASFPAEGVARVTGTAHGEALLKAPLSGRPCLAWDLHVEQLIQNGDHRRWQFAVEGMQTKGFTIRDATGSAVVAVDRGFAGLLTKDEQSHVMSIAQVPPEVDELIVERGYVYWGDLYDLELRIDEGVILPGDRITISGNRMDEDENQLTIGSAESPLLITK